LDNSSLFAPSCVCSLSLICQWLKSVCTVLNKACNSVTLASFDFKAFYIKFYLYKRSAECRFRYKHCMDGGWLRSACVRALLQTLSLTLVHGRIIVQYTERQAVVVIKVFLLSLCDPATSVLNIPLSMHIITGTVPWA
jgi:hypothetical protein